MGMLGVQLTPLEPSAADPKKIGLEQGIRAAMLVMDQHLLRSHAVIQRISAIPALKISGQSRSTNTHEK